MAERQGQPRRGRAAVRAGHAMETLAAVMQCLVGWTSKHTLDTRDMAALLSPNCILTLLSEAATCAVIIELLCESFLVWRTFRAFLRRWPASSP